MARVNALAAATSTILLAAAPAAAQDARHGATLFGQCRACHEVGEGARNKSGPVLNNIIGREAGTIEGFRYSEPMQMLDLIWTEDRLDAFLEHPRRIVPETRMAYRGMADPSDRADVIAFLAQFSDAAEPAAEGLSPEAEAVLATEPDLGYGAYLSSECTACHKPNAEQGIPAIVGMAAEAFVPAMLAYRSGEREHQVMNMMASRLGDEEIASLAAYFELTE